MAVSCAHVVGCSSPMELQTYAELISSGLSQAELDAKVRAGALVRVRRGVYGESQDLSPEDVHRRMIVATMPAVHPDCVVSHESAAVLHGLPVPRSALEKVNLVRRSGGHGTSSGRLRVRASRLRDDEVTTVSGLRVTTLTRTVMDLSRSLGAEWGVAIADAGLRAGLDRDALVAELEGCRRLPGLARARWVARFADARAESPAESVSRVQFFRHGVPAPELQVDLHDDDGHWVARVDFLWEEDSLVGECDGMSKYGALLAPGRTAAMAVRDEKRREEAIRDLGYGITRWDWGLAWQGERLGARVRRAGSRRRGGGR